MDSKKTSRMLMLLAILAAGSLSIASINGCSPAMRKKFIRQKKKDVVSEVIPVLEPMDYENKMEDVKTRHDYFYALLKVWHKDALMLLEDEPSAKQMVYTLRQIRVQLEELDKIIDGKPDTVIGEGLKKVDEIMLSYERPEAFRNRDIIRKDIQDFRDDVIRLLDYESVKNYLRME
ncbi:MAG: hypothetical protein AB1650_05140 [Candidatus Omnitrophota bacterium]